MLRVVHVIVALEIGGAELMLYRLATSQNAEPLVHSVVSLTSEGEVGRRLKEQNVQVRALGLSRLGAILFGFWRLRTVLRELKPDVVQTWMYHADILGGLAARSLGIRNVIWGVRTTHPAEETSRITRWIANLCGPLSRHVPRLVVCAAEASRLSHIALGYDASRMRVINNGFDIALLRAGLPSRGEVREKWGLNDQCIVIGTAGRFSPVKDFRAFIKAASRVAREVPQSRFVMAGRGLTRDNAELCQWISEESLVERFLLLGELRDMPAFMAAIDVYCLSSRSEGFPNVVGEAMAAGVPCVVTDVGDAALLLGDCGTVVPKGDPAALGMALTRMAKLDANQRSAIGACGAARIADQFSMDRAMNTFANTYRQLVGNEDSAH